MTREPTKPPAEEYKLYIDGKDYIGYIDIRVLNISLLQDTRSSYNLDEKERSAMEFRELNDDEREAFMTLDFKGRLNSSFYNWTGHLQVQYINQPDNPGNRHNLRRLGSSTICCVIDRNNPTLKWVGVSRRSFKDKPNRVRGNMLAFIRAITSSPIPR